MIQIMNLKKLRLVLFTAIVILSFSYLYFFIDLKINNLFIAYIILSIFSITGYIYILFCKEKIYKKILITISLMSIFSFMLVPIYDVFCSVTGLNGKIDISKFGTYDASDRGINKSRIIAIEFDVTYNQSIKLNFKPKHYEIKLRPGEIFHTSYYVKNLTDKEMTIQAIPSIVPWIANKYFKKIECFCFETQILMPSEETNMNLSFYIDAKIPSSIQRLTLSYTLFNVSNKIL
jgi:cytochrome c oxidase assembly protein subunit 11